MKYGEKRLASPSLTKFTPDMGGMKPYTLKAVVKFSASGSVTQVSIEFEHLILKWNEYPLDANKGFYKGSATVGIFLY